MDRKSLTILGVCFVLFILWGTFTRKYFPGQPLATNTVQNVPSPTNEPQVAHATTTSGTNAVVTTTAPTTSSTFLAHTEIPEQFLVVTNANARYTFTSRGGGLQEVELVGYPETTSTVRQRRGQTNQWATLNSPTVPPIFALLGDESLQGDNVYQLTRTPNGVHAEKTLPNGLTVVKDFQLSTNFLITASVQLENRSKQEITIPSYDLSAGTATPMNPEDRGYGQMVQWFDGSHAAQVGLSYFSTNTSTLLGMMPRTPKTQYLEGNSNVVWVAPQNQFFVMATIPEKPAQAVVVHAVDLPAPTEDVLKENPNAIRNPRGLESALVYPGLRLAPGGVAASQFNIFAGPKEYQTLAALSARFNNDIDKVMNYGWFGPISKALLVTMNWIHNAILLPYGWIIIFITVFLKVIFWPLTAASTRSAKRMQELQPQLKAMQEKYKDDPQKLPQKQWEFYKKHHINPMAGCLPMLLQVPVFIGFYYMLRTSIELRGVSFLWIGDLSKPDTVATLHLGAWFIPINPLPLIMGVTQLIQMRLTPMSPGMDASQQKMMKYMPLLYLLFMYNMSSGLVLYWTVSNVLAIVQTKLTRTQTPATSTPAAKPVAPMVPQKKKK